MSEIREGRLPPSDNGYQIGPCVLHDYSTQSVGPTREVLLDCCEATTGSTVRCLGVGALGCQEPAQLDRRGPVPNAQFCQPSPGCRWHAKSQVLRERLRRWRQFGSLMPQGNLEKGVVSTSFSCVKLISAEQWGHVDRVALRSNLRTK